MSVVDVAVGVVIRADGRVLFGQRVPGKPYAGWWEFPGGKLEPGETVEQALARELHEELGLTVLDSRPWVVRDHVYPHATVRLHFQRIWSFDGEPQSREGQRFVWCDPAEIGVAPMLPAAIPVIGWLRLPDFYGISNAAESGIEAFLRSLAAALAGGLRLVQLREPTLPPDQFADLFDRARALCSRAGASLLVNSTHAGGFAQACDGVHLSAAELMRVTERPRVRRVAASCHDAAEVERAGWLGVDFAVLGPVLPTLSHPGAASMGWARFEVIARQTRVPLFALGGLDRGALPEARRAGAHGVAALRAAWIPT